MTEEKQEEAERVMIEVRKELQEMKAEIRVLKKEDRTDSFIM
jgi:hypothetical protein